MTTSLGHMPGERWAFDARVTDCFDDMLARSIPQHDEMRRIVFETGSQFVQAYTDVLDLGCSRGEALAPFVDRFPLSWFIGLDSSQPMVDVAQARFEHEHQVSIRTHDFRLQDLRLRPNISLTLGVLTLMFVPMEYRPKLVQQVYDLTVPGGAFLVVEKLLGESAQTTQLMIDRYLRMKADNGYSAQEIDAKRHSLEGVQVCLPASGNVHLLQAAGFRQVECIWRWYNFGAFLAIK